MFVAYEVVIPKICLWGLLSSCSKKSVQIESSSTDIFLLYFYFFFFIEMIFKTISVLVHLAFFQLKDKGSISEDANRI